MWVPTLGPLFLSLVCGICIGCASDACRICFDFVGFAFLGVSKTYGNIKKAIGFIPPHLPFYKFTKARLCRLLFLSVVLSCCLSVFPSVSLSPLNLETVLP